ncbi:MAG: hypothetical protein D6813_00400 [Calditrichaeota bacterium]|nr:MAG: hypothetical protein D6813_00400 [Calditrichota bacterium]
MSSLLKPEEKERFERLLMQVIDGELTHEEQEEFEKFLRSYPELKDEFKQYQKLKEVTRTMKFKSPSAEVWDHYWTQVYNRLERGLAWILVSIGAIILFTYALYEAALKIIADPNLPRLVKLGILALVTGLVILLVSVIREKIFVRKSDKYKEVQR